MASRLAVSVRHDVFKQNAEGYCNGEMKTFWDAYQQALIDHPPITPAQQGVLDAAVELSRLYRAPRIEPTPDCVSSLVRGESRLHVAVAALKAEQEGK